MLNLLKRRRTSKKEDLERALMNLLEVRWHENPNARMVSRMNAIDALKHDGGSLPQAVQEALDEWKAA